MCGIAGFISAFARRSDADGLARALQTIEHRGPDDGGILTFPVTADRGPQVGLGNRRLSIIDLSPAGHQPMTTGDGRYSITYNGEIYNYRELRRELEATGRRFRSASDTEVMLEAYAEWGPNGLPRVEGMFAFAILDRRERRLVLARDGFGIKPLFYSRQPDRLVFASEIGAIFAFGGVGRRINPARTRDYAAAGNVGFGAETMFAEIQQVPPAHCLDIPLDLSKVGPPVRYWSADDGTRRSITLHAAGEELQALLTDSVRLHLRSDVPIGFSLSGGMDSSSVLLAGRKALGPSADLRAFSFVADDPAISEAVHQKRAAAASGATLHSVSIHATEVARDFDRTVDIQGEPFGSPTIYAQYRVFARARETGVKVMLGGQGSDELFAGYQTYFRGRAASLLRHGRFLSAARFVSAAASRWGTRPSRLLTSSISLALPTAVEHAMRRLQRPRATALGWLSADWIANQGLAATPSWRPNGLDVLKEQLVHVIESAHLQGLMRYEDRTAMALSIENRVPFLTPRMARFAFSMPDACLVSARGEHKAVLRQAMRGVIPDAILDRHDRIGFAVPVVRWLTDLSAWVETKLVLASGCPAIDAGALRRDWEAVQERGDVRSAMALWHAISLVTWAERSSVAWQ